MIPLISMHHASTTYCIAFSSTCKNMVIKPNIDYVTQKNRVSCSLHGAHASTQRVVAQRLPLSQRVHQYLTVICALPKATISYTTSTQLEIQRKPKGSYIEKYDMKEKTILDQPRAFSRTSSFGYAAVHNNRGGTTKDTFFCS